MPVFMTKKQKALMRERRRKQKKLGISSQTEPEKRKLSIDDQQEEQQPQQPQTDPSRHQPVIVPSSLSVKEAKKFRKEARRKARALGQADGLLEFVSENEKDKRSGETEHDDSTRAKKRKRSFPCIKDLLQEQKKLAEEQKQEEERKLQESKLPNQVKDQYLALDCEMVGIGSDGKQSALARVSLVDWHGKTVLDTFVKVPSRVTDFRTHVSGVTAKHLHSNNAMELHACRRMVGDLLKDKILVGHALKNDLHALLLNHPKTHIRDTAKYRPFQRASGKNGGKWRPRKLRDLVKEHLGQDIQVAGEAHDSTEDARATMDLFKSVRAAWERELEKKTQKRKKYSKSSS